MPPLCRLAVYGLALLQPLTAAYDICFPDTQLVYTPRGLTPLQAQLELGPLLSNTSSIFGPTDPRWANATTRYQNYARPYLQLVVQPGLESDIPTIVRVTMSLVKVYLNSCRCIDWIAKTQKVRYCNNKSVDFLLVNRGHALTSTAKDFSGIQIDVKSLTGMAIAQDNQTVRLQAGTYSYEVIGTLWKQGYITGTDPKSPSAFESAITTNKHGLLL